MQGRKQREHHTVKALPGLAWRPLAADLGTDFAAS
jgi:hypothetical protein